jgi:hypothetical protein
MEIKLKVNFKERFLITLTFTTNIFENNDFTRVKIS